MKITFDPAKNARNIAKHGIDFTEAAYFHWNTAIIERDDRKDYGEDRYNALGYLGSALYFLSFTYRQGTARVISLRAANEKERKRYEENT